MKTIPRYYTGAGERRRPGWDIMQRVVTVESTGRRSYRPSPMLSPMRLISWNLHGPPFAQRRPERMAAAAREIVRRAPDVAALQEVWFQEDADTLAAAFGSAYEPIDVPQDAWLGRKGGLLAFVRKAGAFAPERRVARFEMFEATASPFKLWQGDGIAGKGIQVIELRRRDSGDPLVVLNTHLQAQYGDERYVEVRQSQLGQLNAVASAIDATVPVLAAGDLNTTPEEAAPYATIAGAWNDLTAGLRRDCGCGTTVRDASKSERHEWIDYILARRAGGWEVSGRVESIRNARVDDPFSDHDGLDATIEIRRAASASLSRRALAAVVLRGPSTRRAWLAAAGLAVLDPFLSKPHERG